MIAANFSIYKSCTLFAGVAARCFFIICVRRRACRKCAFPISLTLLLHDFIVDNVARLRRRIDHSAGDVGFVPGRGARRSILGRRSFYFRAADLFLLEWGPKCRRYNSSAFRGLTGCLSAALYIIYMHFLLCGIFAFLDYRPTLRKRRLPFASE